MHTTTNPSVAAAADQIEATLANVRCLTARNRLLADPVAGDQYVIDCLRVNLHAQWAEIDEIDFETDGTLPTAFPRVVQADHYEGEGGMAASCRGEPTQRRDQADCHQEAGHLLPVLGPASALPGT